MKALSRNFNVKLIAAGALMLSVYTIPAHASTSQITRLKSEGFRTCQTLGNTGYTAIVQGLTLNGGGQRDGGLGNFRIRYCLNTRAECEHFIGNITSNVRGIFDIKYASCKSRAS